jgi:beta-lactamase class A
MTTYLVAEALAQKTLSLQQPVTVSERAWRTQGSRSFVPVNKGVSVDDLFKGMVIQSGNDASVALAEAIGGSEDVRRDDEPHGAAHRPQGHELPQCQRLLRRAGADPLFDRARPRQTRRGADPRPSRKPMPCTR